MAILKQIGIAACFLMQGVVTLGVMVVIPVAWFFFGWSGPVVRFMGNSFVWSVADALLWLFASFVAMFVT